MAEKIGGFLGEVFARSIVIVMAWYIANRVGLFEATIIQVAYGYVVVMFIHHVESAIKAVRDG